jgi:hypothetical protein
MGSILNWSDVLMFCAVMKFSCCIPRFSDLGISCVFSCMNLIKGIVVELLRFVVIFKSLLIRTEKCLHISCEVFYPYSTVRLSWTDENACFCVTI